MKQYIYSLMTDKRNDFTASLIKSILLFISFFYGLAVKAIRPIRVSTAKDLPCKVVSVGNLTLGGTGKTPTACMLAKSLKEEGRRPSVLIRGYGDDEWKMLESLLGDIPLLVGKDRVAIGKKAASLFNSDTIILDDGFQHWRLKRDFDIVLIDSTNPFGNGRLFPRGILREDIKNLKRADMIILTKADMGKYRIKDIKEELKRIAPQLPILESIHSPLWFYNLNDGKVLELAFAKDKKVLCLSSIVNTEYFEYTLKSIGVNIASRFHYPDHYNYKSGDLEFVFNKCKKSNIDTIVTTEKDAVKLTAIEKPSAVIASPAFGGAKQSQEEIASLTSFARNDSSIRISVLHIELKVTDGLEILEQRLRSLYST